MELRDLIVTPIYLLLFMAATFIARPFLTDEVNRRYFFPAFFIHVMGALALGFIYQFYYGGGDTFNFHTGGSRIIWNAFMENPSAGLGLIFSDGHHEPQFFQYSTKIYFFRDQSSFFVIRLAALFDILTFSSYSATALFFAFFSFIGSWFLFKTFYLRYASQHRWIALATIFIPSVFFWGSGIMKDTLVMGCLGLLTWLLDQLFIQKRVSILKIVLLLVLTFTIFEVKKFILQAFFPAAIIWIYLSNMRGVPSIVLRIMIFPIALGLTAAGSYYAALKIGEDDKRYALENIVSTSQVTARDIRFMSGRMAGSGYELSEFFDGSIGNSLRLAPEAIIVTLFRPFLWEVKNPLMLMSSIESFAYLVVTLVLLFKRRIRLLKALLHPDVAFTTIFSLVYGFAVGVSTYNFGTLVRYKIPMLPFFALALIILNYLTSDKNEAELEETENLASTA